jgi:uncharacterized cupin superfamily protein
MHDLEAAGPGGAARFIRRALGVEAFGINWFELPPGTKGREHDESQSDQEEVSVVVRGSGIFRVEGEEVPVAEARSSASTPARRDAPSPGHMG